MQYYIWILVNAIFIIGTTLYIWMVHPQDSKVIQSGLLIAQAAVLLFLVNINMHFIFKIIKKSNRRQVRVMLAKFSRKMMKWHVPFAIVGTALILIHFGIMIIKLGPVIGLFHYKNDNRILGCHLFNRHTHWWLSTLQEILRISA